MSAWPRGALTGEGVFETLRWQGALPPTWDLHVERMRRGAEVLAIPWPGDEVLAHCALQPEPSERPLRLRLTLLADGGDPLREAPQRSSVVVATRPLHDDELHPRPWRLALAGHIRNPASPLRDCKHLALAEALLERRRARAMAADDALLLSTTGLVSESTTATLLVGLRDGTVATPADDAAPLPGTTIAALDRLRTVARVRLKPEHLDRVQWALLLNAVVGARAVRRIGLFDLREPPAEWMGAVRAGLGWRA